MEQMPTNEYIELTSRMCHRAVGDEGVVVHLDSGRVIVVNEVGLHIIQQLKNKQTRSDLLDSITSSFDVDLQQATEDLEHYLTELDSEQILKYSHV